MSRIEIMHKKNIHMNNQSSQHSGFNPNALEHFLKNISVFQDETF